MIVSFSSHLQESNPCKRSPWNDYVLLFCFFFPNLFLFVFLIQFGLLNLVLFVILYLKKQNTDYTAQQQQQKKIFSCQRFLKTYIEYFESAESKNDISFVWIVSCFGDKRHPSNYNFTLILSDSALIFLSCHLKSFFLYI